MAFPNFPNLKYAPEGDISYCEYSNGSVGIKYDKEIQVCREVGSYSHERGVHIKTVMETKRISGILHVPPIEKQRILVDTYEEARDGKSSWKWLRSEKYANQSELPTEYSQNEDYHEVLTEITATDRPQDITTVDIIRRFTNLPLNLFGYRLEKEEGSPWIPPVIDPKQIKINVISG